MRFSYWFLQCFANFSHVLRLRARAKRKRDKRIVFLTYVYMYLTTISLKKIPIVKDV